MRSVPELCLAVGVVLAPTGCREEADAGSADTEAGTGGSDATTGGSGGATDTETDEGPWNSLDERPCPDDSFLTHENFGGPFLLNYCTGCHHTGVPADLRQGAPLEINFDTLDDVRGHADRIWFRAADQNATMPPLGAPGEDERALLGEWLACGAPTDADLGVGG